MSYDGLSPAFAIPLQQFLASAERAGVDIGITSGYRSPERQAQLYQQAIKKYGSEKAARKYVAPPGKSKHNSGAAVDLRYANDAARKWAHDNAAAYGLNFRMGHEPWHIELAPSGHTIPASQLMGAPDMYTGGHIAPVSGDALNVGSQSMQGLLGADDTQIGLFEPTMAQRLATNPLLQMGLGILGTDNLGAGAMLGLNRASAAQSAQQRFQLELAQTLGGRGSDVTAMEKQLMAAGFTPGTPQYQAMMLRLLTQPKTSVTTNVNTGDVGRPPEGMVFVNGKNAKDGMYPVDAMNRPTGAVTYLPDTEQSSSEEVKREGQIGLEGRLVDNLAAFAEKPVAEKLFNLSGKMTEFASADTWTGAVLRSTLDKLPPDVLQATGLNLDDPDIASAMGDIAELRNTTINRISGAAVTEDEAKRIKAQLPSIGQSRTLFMANLARTQANNQYLMQLQQARQNAAPVSTTSAPPTTSTLSPEAARIRKKWGVN